MICRRTSSNFVSAHLFGGYMCNACLRRLIWRSLWWRWSGGHLLRQSSLSHRPGIPTILAADFSSAPFYGCPLCLSPPSTSLPALLSLWLISSPWSPAGGLGMAVRPLLVLTSSCPSLWVSLPGVSHLGANLWLYSLSV